MSGVLFGRFTMHFGASIGVFQAYHLHGGITTGCFHNGIA